MHHSDKKSVDYYELISGINPSMPVKEIKKEISKQIAEKAQNRIILSDKLKKLGRQRSGDPTIEAEIQKTKKAIEALDKSQGILKEAQKTAFSNTTSKRTYDSQLKKPGIEEILALQAKVISLLGADIDPRHGKKKESLETLRYMFIAALQGISDQTQKDIGKIKSDLKTGFENLRDEADNYQREKYHHTFFAKIKPSQISRQVQEILQEHFSGIQATPSEKNELMVQAKGLIEQEKAAFKENQVQPR